MGIFSTIIIAILIFGFLILIHELGHYVFARIFKVSITEFSIGMGPKLFKYVSKKTGITYALSAIPFGGYVAMVGEGEESDDPNSFDKKPAVQRFIITVMGALVNIVAGFIAMLIFTAIVRFGGTEVAAFLDTDYTATSADFLEVGDTITHINGKRVTISDELSYEIMRSGYKPIDVTVIRDGRTLVLEDVTFPTAEESGQVFGVMDFQVYASEKNLGSVIVQSFAKSVLIVRMCWETLFDLITGRYTIAAVSGPVGISEAIGNAASQDGVMLIYIVAVISINLGVMNLLPLPALDGGRSVFTLLEMIFGKRILKLTTENTIHAVGLAILLLFSVFIMIKDVIGLFG